MTTETETGLEIAVIGLACRFPGAENVEEFWQNLLAGEESISHFSKEEMLAAGTHPYVFEGPYIDAAGVLSQVDQFDAGFFGYTPREAELMDPQIRVYLQLCWSALESAGCNPFQSEKSIGIFAASRASDYYLHYLRSISTEENAWQIDAFNAASSLATMVAYNLDLKGPAVSLQTACSGSLVAIHQACRSILCGDCDMALAGGVSIFLPQERGRAYQEGMILSQDGHCKAFAQDADGTVCSSGAGVVLLKRLSDAIEDKDPIYAIIKGSAINNDGKNKMGFTAPSVEGQKQVIHDALHFAEVDVNAISYIETHGTATKLGDSIELEALTEAFVGANKKQFCAIGSVKSNIGHTDSAAGVAGFIKTVLALKHKKIPAHLHFQNPNPQIDFANSPFYVNTGSLDWDGVGQSRYAGVSSFGIGGTNAHVILMDADRYQIQQETDFSRPQLFCLSAKTEASLENNAKNLTAFLGEHPEANQADVAYTLQVKKSHFAFKQIQIGQHLFTGHFTVPSQSLVFMFPGQGSQYLSMGQALYEHYPEYRHWFDYCADRVLQIEGFDLRQMSSVKETYYAQIALFAVEFSLAKLWMSLGLMPQVMIGHSLGEYVAACLSGVFNLDEALNIICLRARLVQKTDKGAMIAVAASSEKIALYLNDGLSIAAVNTLDSCVISGPVSEIESLKVLLNQDGINFTTLYVTRAFHSALIDPILEEFKVGIEGVQFQAPKIPFVSSMTGRFVEAAEVMTPEYWTRHLRTVVRFAEGLQTLSNQGYSVYLEIGPGQQLCHCAASTNIKNQARGILSSLPSHREQESISTEAYFLTTLGKLWLYGTKIDFTALWSGQSRQIVVLPTYVFDTQSYWVETELLHLKEDMSKIDHWFYSPVWKQLPLLQSAGVSKHCVVFADENQFCLKLIEKLREQGHTVTVILGPEKHFALPDYEALFAGLHAKKQGIDRIIYFWGITVASPLDAYRHLLYLIQAYTKYYGAEPVSLAVWVSELYSILGNEQIQSNQASLAGLLPVIAQEYPNIQCQMIDTDMTGNDLPACLHSGLPLVAYRNGKPWIRDFEPLDLKQLPQQGILKNKGVYIISGGLGNLGLLWANYLAQECAAHIILLGRTAIKEDKKQKLLEIEKAASSVQICQFAIEDHDVLQALAEELQYKHGGINGFIHAAGNLSEEVSCPIQQTSMQQAEAQFSPKITGVYSIAKVFGEKNLDFCLLVSSLSSSLGGLGLASYAAANAYLDAFAYEQSSRSSYPWMAVDFDGWYFGQKASSDLLKVDPQKLIHYRAGDAGFIFEKLFKLLDLRQVLISTTNLNTRYDNWVRQLKNDLLEQKPAQTLHSRRNILTPYLAPSNEYEIKMVAIWQSLLGISEIGVKDHFFELGGHSLLALQLAMCIRQEFKVDLPTTSIFEAPSIMELAKMVESLSDFVEGEI